jgi:hypothetical protein
MPTAKVELARASGRISLAAFGDRGDRLAIDATNVAMLALLTRCAPTTWLVRPSASRVVQETDLHSIPLEPPQLMLDHGIVETRRPETGERLWGDIASLGWYSLENTWWLIGLSYPDGYRVVRWSPRWTGEDLADELPPPGFDPGALVARSQRADYEQFAREASRYLITLALLAEVDPSPLRIVLDKRETRERKRKVIDVFFDGDNSKRSREPLAEPALDPTHGRIAKDARVRGHMKRQRYGEGRAEVKWIYVQGFQSRRWLSSRWLVSAVGTGEDVGA